MPLKTHVDDQSGPNLTPLIDVVFLLVIFFMAGTKFTEMERKIGLQIPEVVDRGALSEAPAKRQVNVFRDGMITLDREAVSLKELTNKLADIRKQYPGLGVMIRGDGAASYQQVAEVFNACKQAGIADLGMAVRVAAEGK